MISLLLVRHGQTEWSRDGRIQGRTDTELSAGGRSWLMGQCLPAEFADWDRFSSPLRRCLQTCECLGLDGATAEPRLIEMDWGDWEGKSLAALRAELGEAMRDNEGRGFDFRPAGGESPREVLARVQSWLVELVWRGRDAVAVTHRGVIRVVMAQALGWDMLGRPPVKLDWNAAHQFQVDDSGRIGVLRMNRALLPRASEEGQA